MLDPQSWEGIVFRGWVLEAESSRCICCVADFDIPFEMIHYNEGWAGAEEGGAAGSNAAAISLRGFTYQAIAQLGERVPAALQADTDVPRRFFHALAVEPPGVRASLQESLSALAAAYKGSTGEASHDEKG